MTGRRITAAIVGALFALGSPLAAGAAHADGQASIDHSEVTGGGLRMLVSVPGDASVDLGSVATTIDGATVSSKAADANTSDTIRRVTMLALDTSDSMKGARISEAEKAAKSYLDSVPANVDVGIVTFDGSVDLALAPTRNRDQARQVIDSIQLGRGTSLYDGIARAAAAMGTAGQRQILLLSDGKDTTSTTLASAVKGVRTSGVRLDAVTLQTTDADNTALSRLTAAGKGSLLDAADPTALSATYAKEASALARQVLVTAKVPAGKAHDASVQVSLTAGGQTYTDSAYIQVRDTGTTPAPKLVKPTPVGHGSGLPWAIALAAIVAVGLGLGGLVLTMAGPKKEHRPPPSVEDQIKTYGPSGTGARPGERVEAKTGLTDQFRDVAGRVLENNKSLEAKIEGRLEAAALSLKPSEWLLIHAGIVVAFGAVGVLLGGGNIVFVLLSLIVGAVAPWFYLGLKRSRRVKAFNNGIADTLQLMAGSLSAGLSLAQSLDTVVREGTEPICSEFRRVIVESRLGVSIDDALDGVAQRMESKDFAWVVMAIRIQRQVGGNLAELLNTVAATLRERAYLRRHVSALSAEGRLSAWILGALPPAFLAYLTLTKPDYVNTLYTTPLGILMCIAMVLLLVVGVFWMSKVAKV
ncbi:MAG TPA: type II secretion system F family protein, partial [Marmoricola sp.]